MPERGFGYGGESGERESEHAPGLFDRIGNAWIAAGELIATRREIFGVEVSEKLAILGRGAAAIGLALALCGIAILLLTALLASLFAMLFGSAWAGILATLVLYLIGIAAATFYGWKSLSKLRLDFPATKQGLADDWASVRAALAPPRDPDDAEIDVEQRFRAGSE